MFTEITQSSKRWAWCPKDHTVSCYTGAPCLDSNESYIHTHHPTQTTKAHNWQKLGFGPKEVSHGATVMRRKARMLG